MFATLIFDGQIDFESVLVLQIVFVLVVRFERFSGCVALFARLCSGFGSVGFLKLLCMPTRNGCIDFKKMLICFFISSVFKVTSERLSGSVEFVVFLRSGHFTFVEIDFVRFFVSVRRASSMFLGTVTFRGPIDFKSVLSSLIFFAPCFERISDVFELGAFLFFGDLTFVQFDSSKSPGSAMFSGSSSGELKQMKYCVG